jgi:serine/threonine protein kinase
MRTGWQLVLALDARTHIHGVGIIHRDVRPGNILLGRDGRARLTDFGIAQPEDAAQLTQLAWSACLGFRLAKLKPQA